MSNEPADAIRRQQDRYARRFRLLGMSPEVADEAAKEVVIQGRSFDEVLAAHGVARP